MDERIIELIDPDVLMCSALEYLEIKYGRPFAKYRVVTYTPLGEHFAYAAVPDEDGEPSAVVKLKALQKEDGSWSFTDDHIQNIVRDRIADKIRSAGEKYGSPCMVFHQVWYGSVFQGEDGLTDPSEDECLRLNAGSIGGWYVFIENEANDKTIARKLLDDLEESGIYGSFSVFVAGKNALMLLSRDNYLEYFDDEDIGTDVCSIRVDKDIERR